MAPSVKIDLRSAKALAAMFPSPGLRCVELLRIAIARAESPRAKAVKSSRRKEKDRARFEKNDETRTIRAAVFARAESTHGRPAGYAICEVCGRAAATDLSHVFGRVRVHQSERNCLASCRPCHVEFTNPKSGAAVWRLASEALERLGFEAEAKKARGRAEFCEARDGLPFVPGVAP